MRAVRNAERVLIRCEDCHRRLFAYYVDPEQWHEGETPPADGDPFLIQQVERDLLERVSEPAQVLYDYLRRYIGRYGYAPTLREMQAAVGWQSANSATYYLAQLEEVGLIERDYGASRGIRLVHVA